MGSFRNVDVSDPVEVPKNVVKGFLSSYHEMESYVATLEVLLDKKLVRDISRVKSEVKRGDYVEASAESLQELFE